MSLPCHVVFRGSYVTGKMDALHYFSNHTKSALTYCIGSMLPLGEKASPKFESHLGAKTLLGVERTHEPLEFVGVDRRDGNPGAEGGADLSDGWV